MDNESKQLLSNLISQSKIANLGTCINNEPYVSMVSYSVSKDLTEYFVLISQLAVHTKNIQQNPNISLMICQPENVSDNPQALARVTLKGKAELIERISEEFEKIKQNYLLKNPKAKLYFGLGDFHLFKLKITTINFVAGFGKAFKLFPENLRQFFL